MPWSGSRSWNPVESTAMPSSNPPSFSGGEAEGHRGHLEAPLEGAREVALVVEPCLHRQLCEGLFRGGQLMRRDLQAEPSNILPHRASVELAEQAGEVIRVNADARCKGGQRPCRAGLVVNPFAYPPHRSGCGRRGGTPVAAHQAEQLQDQTLDDQRGATIGSV